MGCCVGAVAAGAACDAAGVLCASPAGVLAWLRPARRARSSGRRRSGRRGCDRLRGRCGFRLTAVIGASRLLRRAREEAADGVGRIAHRITAVEVGECARSGVNSRPGSRGGLIRHRLPTSHEAAACLRHLVDRALDACGGSLAGGLEAIGNARCAHGFALRHLARLAGARNVGLALHGRERDRRHLRRPFSGRAESCLLRGRLGGGRGARPGRGGGADGASRARRARLRGGWGALHVAIGDGQRAPGKPAALFLGRRSAVGKVEPVILRLEARGRGHVRGVAHLVERLNPHRMHLFGRHLIFAVAHLDRGRLAERIQRRLSNLLGRVRRHDVAALRDLRGDAVGCASAGADDLLALGRLFFGLRARLESVHGGL
jgi:hypothetical protein